MGGGRGGDGRSTKKHSRKGKLNEKNSCTPINPKKYSYYGLKKIQSRNLITKKIFALENSPPPPPPYSHNFSNGPSLTPLENCYSVFCLFWCCCCYCCFRYHSKLQNVKDKHNVFCCKSKETSTWNKIHLQFIFTAKFLWDGWSLRALPEKC